MRIVIERGHGPHDPGAIGPTGLTEYEVVRDVCRRLLDKGYEVKGRDRRLSILLWQLRFNRPDVVVSVHCNAGSKKTHECRVYVRDDEPRPSIRMHSLRLANLLAEQARGLFAEKGVVHWFPITRRGKDFTPGILKGTARKAMVVVELGFISDPHVEDQMRTDNWRARAALGIDEAIKSWLKSYGG